MSYGNVAKYYIRKQIEARLNESEAPLTIADLGCGPGTQWEWLYEGYRDRVKLFGIEPNAQDIQKARKRYPEWEFVAAPAYTQSGVAADVVTSLSALEHVYRRKAFLNTAYRLLKQEGTFYLNYDNGHFFEQSKLRVLASQVVARFGYERHYLAFVWQEEIEALIKEANFTVTAELNFHQATRKEFAKVFTGSARQEFHEAWLDYELRVNAVLRRDRDALKQANSNRIVLSKVFALKKVAA